MGILKLLSISVLLIAIAGIAYGENISTNTSKNSTAVLVYYNTTDGTYSTLEVPFVIYSFVDEMKLRKVCACIDEGKSVSCLCGPIGSSGKWCYAKTIDDCLK